MPNDGRHDAAYRLLFSESRMVRDLFGGFLREEWTRWLDLDTLERVDGGDGAEPAARLREARLWRLRWQGGSDWVYLLLKPQAEEEPCMALRMGFLRELLYQDLLRRRATAAGRLPVVLPVVLYHGAARWQAPREAVELFLPIPAPLQRHAPRTLYLLLDAAHDPIPGGAGEGNLVSLLCQLERSQTAMHVDFLLERVVAALISEPGGDSLRQAWSAFLGGSFLPRRFPHLFTAAEAGELAWRLA